MAAAILGFVAPWSTSLSGLFLIEVAIGVAWAVFSVVTLVVAISLGGANGAGTPAGMLFSALAAAAVIRLVLVWTGMPEGMARDALIAACWLVGAGLALVAGNSLQNLGLRRQQLLG